MENAKKLDDLRLKEEMELESEVGRTFVRRVIGGWIYTTSIRSTNGVSIHQVFVPDTRR